MTNDNAAEPRPEDLHKAIRLDLMEALRPVAERAGKAGVSLEEFTFLGVHTMLKVAEKKYEEAGPLVVANILAQLSGLQISIDVADGTGETIADAN